MEYRAFADNRLADAGLTTDADTEPPSQERK